MRTYQEAGVDISRGDRVTDFIRKMKSPALGENLGEKIGGFAGGVRFDPSRYSRPVLLSTCDGVGTKILVARTLKRYTTIGIDLVAMCANDLLACGVKPMVFQDYIACGRIVEETVQEILKGVVAGCEQAGCRLTGGETAEMPDLYSDGDFDLAGFCAGIAEEEEILPRLDRIREGDALLGLPSSGIHSNGLSLARKILPESAWVDLLVPTRIYTREITALAETGGVLAAAHVTGGGLEANLARVIPERIGARLSWDWPRPEVFKHIQKRGGVEESEMRRVFNLGIGVALVVSRSVVGEVLGAAKRSGIPVLEIGELAAIERGEVG